MHKLCINLSYCGKFNNVTKCPSSTKKKFAKPCGPNWPEKTELGEGQWNKLFIDRTLRSHSHWIPCEILRQNDGLILILSKNKNINFGPLFWSLAFFGPYTEKEAISASETVTIRFLVKFYVRMMVSLCL